MNIERRVQLWTYAKFAGMFFVGILFAVLAQAVAQTTNTEADEKEADKAFEDCLESTSSLLSERRQALIRREKDIYDKEKNIREAKKNLQDQIDDLRKIRSELDEKMKDMDAKKMEKVKAIVARFEKVRAKQAAAILEKTDDDVSVLVLEQMNAAKSGKILAAMNADKAAYLTERLAQHPIKKGRKAHKGKLKHMSIDTYTYPLPPQGGDKNSQRTSLQRGGFSSMMDVLTQNEAMNQTDNDAFAVPLQEEVIESAESSVPVQKPLNEDVSHDPATVPEEPIEQGVAVLENVESMDALIAPVITPSVHVLNTPVPTLDAMSVEASVVQASVIPQEIQVPVVDIESAKPLPQYTPVPKGEAPVQIEVPFIEDVPEAIMEWLPKVVASPLNEKIVEQNPVHVQVDAAEVIPALPKVATPLKAVKRNMSVNDSSKNPDEAKTTTRQVELFATEASPSKEADLEEDPKVRFVRYVEKEIVAPKFAKGQDESLHVPDEMHVQKDVQNPSSPTNGVLGSEKATRAVSSVARSEGTQASSLLEKGSAKEELKMPKRKLEQSFAKLLKEAKELAEDFEPEFHTKILKKLEIQVKDPTGIIQLEIAQKEAMVHIRAVVPSEAMSDLHYLGQDVQESLQDLGLQLGSYELRSQDEEEEQAGFGGMDEIGFDDIETEDVESTISDYIVDKRV